MKEINISQATAVTSPPAPLMLAFALGKAANSGENIRRMGKAVLALAAPGVSLKDAVMAYGSSGGSQKDKPEEMPVALQDVEGGDIQIPEDSGIAFIVSLEQTVESGDH